MRRTPSGIIYSPTDLTTFVESPFASWMNRLQLESPGKYAKDAADESNEIVKAKGMEHEKKVLETLEARLGSGYARIPSEGSFETRHELTLLAMKSGAPLIYQAALRYGEFQGYADFLVRKPGRSALGDFQYEPWDSKLAHRPKPYFVVQLCCYAEMIEAVQRVRPEFLTLVLGKNDEAQLRLEDFYYYYLSLKAAFLHAQKSFDPGKMPFPAKSEEVRDWSEFAERLRNERDHLSLVAGVTDLQIRKLESAGITTLTGLAGSKEMSVPKMDPSTFEKLRQQSSLQLRSRGLEKPLFELLKHEPGSRRGLALLPPESPNDVFFDMEGYPLIEGGLEYLFGVTYVEKGKPQFRDWWAHSRLEEKKAFEAFIDWVHARWKTDPTVHIYHYAAYEVTAMRKLMTTHATREDQVDDLLRNEVFVDLYAVVSQGLRIGEPRYSLKNVERIYAEKRKGEVTNAGDSIVQYGKWMESPDGLTWVESKVLKDIRDYNRVDCESTWQLASWLRGLQKKAELPYVAPIREDKEASSAPRDTAPAVVLAEQIAGTLGDIEGAALSDDSRTRLLLAHVLQFHKREAKTFWWSYFDRLLKTDDELVEDADCLGALKRTAALPRPEKRSMLFDYAFDPAQETKIHAGSGCCLRDRPDAKVEVFSIDTDRGLVTLKAGPKVLAALGALPEEVSLIPDDLVRQEPIPTSIYTTVNGWKSADLRPEALPQALKDFLYRAPPRLSGRTHGQPVVRDEKDLVSESVGAVEALTDSTLCIQGPPGTGKTHTAARMIVSLIRTGKKIGISSNSHKVIENLMREVATAAKETGVTFVGAKIGTDETPGFTLATGFAYTSKDRLPTNWQLVGGTAWAFSWPGLAGKLDHLFIDEAGQVSVANLVGMAPSSRNLVLMGDQMQLEQPVQGAHPGESGESALAYLLRDYATIPREQGIFLGVSRRMHPEVCKFVSDSVYEGRLQAHPDAAERKILLPARKPDDLIHRSVGILYVPVEHEGNSHESEEEAQAIRKLIDELLLLEVQEAPGKSRKLTREDILVVAPYNLQVNRLRESLGNQVRVGTVDKFQGQEAYVAILSMCSSTGDASARGAEFLFNQNRINVALSRAKCLSIVVGAPALAQSRCDSIDAMRRVNLFCKILHVGRRSTPTEGD